MQLRKWWVCVECGDTWEMLAHFEPDRNAEGGVICDECAMPWIETIRDLKEFR